MINKIRDKFETNDNFRNISIAVIVVVLVMLLFWAASPLLSKFTTVADKQSFYIDDTFYVVINHDEAVYNEESGADDFHIYMTAFNYSPPRTDYQDINETGWDENTPTTDQLSEEEKNSLNYYESEKINEKTINEVTKELSQSKSVSAYVDVAAYQGTTELKLPVAYEDLYGDENDESYEGTPTIFENVKSGESYSFDLVVQLKDSSHMTLNFVPNPTLIPDAEPIFITFDVSQRLSPQMREKVDQQNKEIAEKQSVESINMPACTVNLLDGWYAEREFKANVKLANPKYPDASISISYSSSMKADKLMDNLNSQSTNPVDISQITIKGKTYYRADRTDGSILLTTDGIAGNAVQIIIIGVTYDQALPILESLTF